MTPFAATPGWSKERGQSMAAAYVPLSFAPGEAFQFDWSHEIVVLSGVTTIVKVAHVRLCHSRMLFVRAYLQCPRCGRIIEETHKFEINARGAYVAPGQRVDPDGHVPGEPSQSFPQSASQPRLWPIPCPNMPRPGQGDGRVFGGVSLREL